MDLQEDVYGFLSADGTCSIGCGTQPSERRAATAVAVWGLHPVTMSGQPHSDCHCDAWILHLPGQLTLHAVMKVAVAAKGVPTPCCTQAVRQQVLAVG